MSRSILRLGCVALSAMIASIGIPAFPAEPGAAPFAAFSTPARAVLTRLDTMSKGLPDGAWRYHAGDVAHGEDPTLDDSAWSVGKGKYETPEGSVWFRQTFVMPARWQGYDLRNVRLFFQFHSFAHGAMPEILYVNGRRIAMGDNMEPVELVDRIEPGQTITVAVKLLHTADVKHISPASYMLRFDPARPSPVDVGDEIRSAAALLPMLVNDTVERESKQRMLDSAACAIDLKALDAGDSAAFDASLLRAQAILQPLRPLLQTVSMRLVGNSHIDTAWVWPWTETVDVVHRTFSTALQLMPEYPRYVFTQPVALYSAWMAEKYPDIFAEMKKRTEEGRWEPVGGMWVEPDLNMPDGESLVRQLLIGKSFLRKEMGVDVNVGWNPDSFGYNWQLPQIYKRSGVDYFVTQKLTWNESNTLPLKLFWWQSPDGSRVLTYFPRSYDQDTEAVGLAESSAEVAKIVPGDETLMQLYGVGDHGGGPTRVMLDNAQRWMQPEKVFPKLEFSTAKSFFTSMTAQLDDPARAPVWNYRTLAKGVNQMPAATGDRLKIPVWNDELYLEFHRGVFTSQARHKRNMRVSERSVLDAEKFASIASLSGHPYPAAPLTEAWKKVLFNQFHDLAAGSSIPVVYTDAERDYESVRQTTGEVQANALAEIAAKADTRTHNGAVPVIVFNPLGWQRTDLVDVHVQLAAPAKYGVVLQAPDGKPMLTQTIDMDASTASYHLLVRAEDIPSLGYKVFEARPGRTQASTDLHATQTTLENAMLRVEIDPANGCIAHLIDKRSGFDAIASGGCGNELQTFVDLPKKYDAWNIDADALDKMTPIRAADAVKLVEQGPLRSAIRVERHFGKSKFTQDIVLYAGMDRVEVKNDFDWQETHTLLKAAFPLAASSGQATYEIPFGSIERPTTRANSIEKAKFEAPALRWADLGDGSHSFSLLNDSKYGYDAVGNVLRLSLLRSPTYPDPNTDRGRQVFTYALYPHKGDWREAQTVRAGYALNDPLIAMQTHVHPGANSEASFVRIDAPNIVLTAVKKGEAGNNLVIRFYESQGQSTTAVLTVPGKALGAEEVGMMEQAGIGALPMAGGKVTIAVKPYEIRTIRVRY
ncbi:alpha-mannosidase [Granulicella rosea]|uniref:Alpha-mannosidase n=1 Tax=Granulicella rosea TaxID=474952 RepID=A0A239M0T0_9BACT|nr:glycoside hydrolase family 38 C-terminal domain-containing protein [Granulicella rosea]SNT35673.1 alpha-mannosidase [Granulicella rosea]